MKNKLKLPFNIKPEYFSLVVLGVIILGFGVWFLIQKISVQKTFAQCLTEKGVVMYGSDTCENCLNQKAIFGSDFKNIKYVNCDFNQAECEQKHVTGYPFWWKGDKILLGVKSFAELKEFAGCAI